MELQLTNLELQILKSSRSNEYGDPAECGVWMWSVIDNSGIPTRQARGVISSLVKKGLCEVDDYEGKGRSNDMCFTLTELGVKYSEEA